MKFKKQDYVLAIFLILLVLVVGCIALIINGNKTKDIRKARGFIEKLQDNDMIENNIDVDSLNFQKQDKNLKQVESETTTVATQEYGIDFNEDYEVVGFSNKANVVGDAKIDKEKAKELGVKYLSKLYDGEASFKDFKVGEKIDELPYYILRFSKMKYGYPYYFDEILVSINKTTGKLDGYTVSNLQGEAKKPTITKTKEDAINIALNKFNEINKKGEVKSEVITAYGLKLESSKKSELTYVVTIDGKDEDNKNASYNYFISVNTGEILDSFRSVVNETKALK